ncbi:MAG TPA: hypothetical protein VNU64_04320 [Burkholderiales bacterium]|nr:hypothetical protein [Burkholderiales bacterium]
MAKPRKKARRTLRALTDEAGITTPKPIERRKKPKPMSKPKK